MSKVIEDYKRKILRLIHCDRILFFLYSSLYFDDRQSIDKRSYIVESIFDDIVNIDSGNPLDYSLAKTLDYIYHLKFKMGSNLENLYNVNKQSEWMSKNGFI